jgi:imidazolonepropionase-like amidohydrolase
MMNVQRNFLLKGAEIFTGERGRSWEKQELYIENGKIGKAGSVHDGVQVLDVTGCYIMPGMVDAHCHIGLFDEAMGFEGEDGNEMTDPITPHMRAIDGMYPADRTFQEALEAGVTTAVTGPGSANVIGGQFAAIKTWGRTVEEMLLQAPVAMKVAFGENPKRIYNEQKKAPMTRMATAALLRETLYKALEYRDHLRAAQDDPAKRPEFDLALESLLPVINGQIPLKAHAHRVDDIMTAIRIAEEFGLGLTLDHCTEGHLIADILAKKGYPAIVGPSFGDRSKVELKNQTFDTPRILAEAGVKVALMTDAPVIPLKHLIMCAQFAVKYGMDPDEALRAITINPAEIIGLQERVGSLTPGKDADLVIFDRNPLDFHAQVLAVLVNGEIVFCQASFQP